MNRRKFVQQSSTAALAILAGTAINAQHMSDNNQDVFIHHVYFWLHNPDKKEDFNALVAGLKKMGAEIKYFQSFHIGKPANTNREVIDSSYSVSWLLFFKNKADQDTYQDDPIHQNFVKECSHLWKKVVVYDTVNL